MLQTCTVSGTVEQPTGAVADGAVVFTPDRFTDVDDKVIVASVPVVADLDPVTAEFSVDLVYSYRVGGDIYSDIYSDIYPGVMVSKPATYHVSEPFGDQYPIEIDATLGGAALLADLHS